MKRKTIAVALMACLALPACGSCKIEAPYKVTLYSCGAAVREWDGVSEFTRWDDQCVGIYVDGESLLVCGGPIVIEHEGNR